MDRSIHNVILMTVTFFFCRDLKAFYKFHLREIYIITAVYRAMIYFCNDALTALSVKVYLRQQ